MTFIDSLRAINRKPALYLDTPSLGRLFAFIVGYQTATPSPDATSALDSFEFWTYHHYHETGAKHWRQIILKQAGGDDAAAFHLFFENLEAYLKERDRIGADAIKTRYLIGISNAPCHDK